MELQGQDDAGRVLLSRVNKYILCWCGYPDIPGNVDFVPALPAGLTPDFVLAEVQLGCITCSWYHDLKSSKGKMSTVKKEQHPFSKIRLIEIEIIKVIILIRLSIPTLDKYLVIQVILIYLTVRRLTLIITVFHPQIKFIRELMPFLEFFSKCISEKLNKISSMLHRRVTLKIHRFLIFSHYSILKLE